MSICLSLMSLVSVVVSPPEAAYAQMTTAPSAGYKRDPGVPSTALPKPLREIGFDQNLDRQVPLDVQFADEHGRVVRLGDYFGARPVVLALVYYDCPMLCTQVLTALTSAGRLSAGHHARREALTLSVAWA